MTYLDSRNADQCSWHVKVKSEGFALVASGIQSPRPKRRSFDQLADVKSDPIGRTVGPKTCQPLGGLGLVGQKFFTGRSTILFIEENSVKLPRSHSSPSPPASKQPLGRYDSKKQALKFRKRQGSSVIEPNARPPMTDWSTSYHAGSSSSGSRASSGDETEDDDFPAGSRGRPYVPKNVQSANGTSQHTSSLRKRSPKGISSGDSTSTPNGVHRRRTSFTRSRSPAVLRAPPKALNRMNSPTLTRTFRRNILPSELRFQLRIPFANCIYSFSIDFRKFGEALILLSCIIAASLCISSHPTPGIRYILHPESNYLLSIELQLLSAVSLIYIVWTHSTISYHDKNITNIRSPTTSVFTQLSSTPVSRNVEFNRRHQLMAPIAASKSDFGYVWMSVPKNYRESKDDGILTGLLLGPLIASALLISSLRQHASSNPDSLPGGWLIENAVFLKQSTAELPASQAVLLSRCSLVELSTFCSTMLLVHVCASWLIERWSGKADDGKPDGERSSVPRSEGRRSWYYILFVLSTSAMMIGGKVVSGVFQLNLWNYLNHFEVVVASLFYQFTLYVALRLAHRGFTLGELAVVCFGGTSLCLETFNLTIARIWPVTTPFIRTYRLPTPLLIFQIALIVGSFVTGFLLSPFLVLSRSNALRPVHRLRFPQEKERNRRYYALAFYVGTVLIIGTLIGFWTRWCLGNRDPWLWAIFWVLQGRKKWTRPALLAYWALLGTISVAGWNRQLARSRRYRPRQPLPSISEAMISSPLTPTSSTATAVSIEPVPVATLPAEIINSTGPAGSLSTPPPSSSGPLGMSFPTTFANIPNLPNLPNLPNSANMSNVATDLLDAADKHVPTLSLNSRRKFFHGLAVIMFIPGVAIDPAFTHLSFSAAFAMFTFAEYVRYFAIYPFGAALHVFMHEFLDHKDSGTAILSHFYLLTGCAGSLWLDGPSMVLQFTGILALGLGDAAASIVGRRLGNHKWSPTSSKTLEGTFAFVASIFVAALLLRLLGHVEPFSNTRYILALVISGLLEALSDQNDNLTLPLFMWSLSVIDSAQRSVEQCRCFLFNRKPARYHMQSNGSPLSSHPEHARLESGSKLSQPPIPNTPKPLTTPTERPHLSGFMIQKRSTPKRPSRPSTAPTADGTLLLPSISSRFPDGTSISPIPSPENEYPVSSQTKSTLANGHSPSPCNDADDGRTDAGSSTMIDILSSMNDASSTVGDDKYSMASHSAYDWRTFIAAYGAGRWDPHKTPNPPAMTNQLSGPQSICTTRSTSFNSPDSDSSQPISPPKASESQSTPMASTSSTYDPRSPSLFPLGPLPVKGATSSIKARTPIPPHLPLPPHRLRNSLSGTLSSIQSGDSGLNSYSTSKDVHTTVATMRWAAARVDISPLALPSPEHELTDPMRGVTTPVPGSHSRDSSSGTDYLLTPGGSRRQRLASFWAGTTDVEGTRLATIEGSPSEPVIHPVDMEPLPASTSPNTANQRNDPWVSIHAPLNGPSLVVPLLPPATAPALQNQNHDGTVAPPTDYFGNARPPTRSSSDEKLSRPSSNPHSTMPPPRTYAADESTDLPSQTRSVPAPPNRRVSLTRQASSPLPVTSPQESRHVGGRIVSTDNARKSTWMTKFEQNFHTLGYLVAPRPPDELERRRALHKFNIWHTSPDHNFDRIAHLVKLVFNTRGVLISLVDDDELWFKTKWGWDVTGSSRDKSLCSHAILQRNDEPTVILDCHNDWRFANNPNSCGELPVRFYAGAPLRTQDGYNIGALVLIDDQPRDEFSPRHRHALKEFAAITMREMELWRDKIQLRIREKIQLSMEQFSRECLEIDTDPNGQDRPDVHLGTSMERVYDRAAKLVQRTLDVEGVVVMDVSHCEVLESITTDSTVSITMHHGDQGKELTRRQLSMDECHNLLAFFQKYPDGRISEGIIPHSFKPFLPTHVQYALMVPIFNIDKRPFALLCAFNATVQAKRSLEGHELSYLRAIGVIILSAVLKRRMLLADKAKGLFISNISHELRTPLHGILAAAELLSESALNPSQASFLQTVQACGSSLVETVNHVLDFTKLSGSGKAGGVENSILPTQVDLLQLVEEAVDGCWIGFRARSAIMGDNGIGSVYSPPRDDQGSPVTTTRSRYVEAIVDVGHRSQGWTVKCERGGIRRVLMNLFGNSLKFTSACLYFDPLDGYVHVVLRQLPPAESDPPDRVMVELAVFDTGKGISQNFLKNQLFHPFSQENPLQTGTGLGLAIVSSIVTSETVGGKVDVWSEEGVGTEIKVTFPVEIVESASTQIPPEMQPFRENDPDPLPAVSLVGFSELHKGIQLLKSTLEMYLTSWWDFEIVDRAIGNILILNEDASLVVAATERRDISRPFIVLSSSRGNPALMSISTEHERIGGFCRLLYKPAGPSRLRVLLKLSVHALAIAKSHSSSSSSNSGSSSAIVLNGEAPHSGYNQHNSLSKIPPTGYVPRRNSEETHARRVRARPILTPRSSTAHTVPNLWRLPTPDSTSNIVDEPDPDTPVPTITIGSGGTLLKASIGTLDAERRFKVLVVEDNSILRNLLIKWLTNKGYDFRSAVDGRDGVTVFEREGPFDVVLLDLSMPILDGVGATSEIRKIEEEKRPFVESDRARILALTGMSSIEDKRRAFEAGVDGYLVKPVAFKTLDEIFQKLGTS
ncbi:hypothetical protein CPB83DRAFT_880691 [Crepidotus variabilis]|uniref:dolichol kinase n=1 Tax=Crepidotus variabilis TaxID=179855 RepID=A0A9P6EP50_9AGAR|nr:hypothetical protein CPB83DRAFT_880691 [Crepidotus variabilis]